MSKRVKAAIEAGRRAAAAVPNYDDLNPNPILQAWVSAYPKDDLDTISDRLAPQVPVTGARFEYPEYSFYSLMDDVETLISNDGGFNVVDKTAPNW
jgi:hypothetical protein